MFHSKMFALCSNPSTIWAIVYVICLLSLMLCANLCVTCNVWYVVCLVLICNMCRSIYDISILLCSMSETNYVVSKNPLYASIHSQWAKIALSVSIFVASSLLCCICKIIQLCSRLYMALAKFTELYYKLNSNTALLLQNQLSDHRNKNCSLFVFAKSFIYAQDYMWHWQNYKCGIGRFTF